MGDYYKDSGVDLTSSKRLVDLIKEKTKNDLLGPFSGVVEHPYLKDYFLVSTVDGIGTKILPLLKRKKYKTIAQDLCAMNLNDLICSGAFGVGFCDYIAVNKIEEEVVSNIIQEIDDCLKKYNIKLMGGETSELNIMNKNSMDICGFAFGMVEKNKILDVNNVKSGDIVIGLCSSGIHSNGFSLIRKLYEEEKISEEDLEKCLEPTYIYVNEILKLVELDLVKACANITGGGIEENLQRAIKKGLVADLKYETIRPQEIFKKLEKICGEECWRVFNMGCGFCVICEKENVDKIMNICQKYNPFVFGEIRGEND